MHLLMKNLKLFTKALLMNVYFFLFKYFEDYIFSVRESVFKILKKKNFTIIKSAFLNNLRFFTSKCTHLLKTSNFGPQGPQNAALQKPYSPC